MEVAVGFTVFTIAGIINTIGVAFLFGVFFTIGAWCAGRIYFK